MRNTPDHGRYTLSTDETTGYILVNGAELELPHQAQRILACIVQAAPRVVGREEIIEMLWPACYATGEKGLRQAIWSIRSRLGDRARSSRFVRTIPRLGYQWIGPSPDLCARRSASRIAAPSRYLGAGLLMLATALGATHSGSGIGSRAASPSGALKVASAVRQGAFVVVGLESGCQAVLRSASGKLAGEPIISGDRSLVMVPVIENEACQLVVYQPGKKGVTRFGVCPAPPPAADPDPFAREKTI